MSKKTTGKPMMWALASRAFVVTPSWVGQYSSSRSDSLAQTAGYTTGASTRGSSTPEPMSSSTVEWSPALTTSTALYWLRRSSSASLASWMSSSSMGPSSTAVSSSYSHSGVGSSFGSMADITPAAAETSVRRFGSSPSASSVAIIFRLTLVSRSLFRFPKRASSAGRPRAPELELELLWLEPARGGPSGHEAPASSECSSSPDLAPAP